MQEISSRFKNGNYKGVSLFGIIKEVAPVSGTDIKTNTI
jgi:hypothetical protein